MQFSDKRRKDVYTLGPGHMNKIAAMPIYVKNIKVSPGTFEQSDKIVQFASE